MKLITNSRLACYYIPTGYVYEYIDSLRMLIQSVTGSKAAMKFPVHFTIQEFFVPNITSPYLTLLDEVSVVVSKIDVFKAKLGNLYFTNDVLYINIIGNDSIDYLFFQLRDSIQRYALFEGANEKDKADANLPPHFTLAMKDFPKMPNHEFEELTNNIVLEQVPFSIDKISLLEFTSSRWNSDWWQSLRWKIIQEFYLGGKA